MSDRPDELRRQLTTLWRAARSGMDSMREVVVRSSQFGKLRLDIALLHREREQLLGDLGTKALAYLETPEGVELPEEMHQLHDQIRELESRIKSDTVKAHDNAFGAPRGFEPEAAADYGDEGHADDEPDETEEEAAPVAATAAPARSPAKRKKTPSRRKGNGVKNL